MAATNYDPYSDAYNPYGNYNPYGKSGVQSKTVTSQAEANALNAQGWQLAAYDPIGGDGRGSWTVQRTGPTEQGITQAAIQAMMQGNGPQQAAINRAYAQQQGATTQNMISRGLYNTTVQDAVNRGNVAERNYQLSQTYPTVDQLASLAMAQAQMSGNGGGMYSAAPGILSTMPRVKTNMDVAALAPGTQYITPNGSVMRKPG